MSTVKSIRAKVRILPGAHAARERPVVAFIPGGPGLSSHTLAGVERLTRSFDVALVDPPGTAGLPEATTPAFDEIVDSLCEALRETKRSLIIAGHSFGGYYALRCLSRAVLPIRGLALVSTPLTPATYAEASKRYSNLKDANIVASEKRWEESPSEETFRAWVSSCSPMFFGDAARERGCRMLLEDRMSYLSGKNLMDLMSAAQLSQELILAARSYRGPKVFLAGADDALYPVDFMKKDAALIPMEFQPISKCGHFPAFENSEEVTRTFERTFNTDKTKEVK